MITEKTRLFFYAKERDGAGKRLQRVIEALVPEKNTEIYRSLYDLSSRLRQPGHNLAICVLLAASREDLSEILLIRDLLSHLRIILVLPDRKDDTIVKGHRLRPRFLTYADSDFTEVAAVLSNMLGDSCVNGK